MTPKLTPAMRETVCPGKVNMQPYEHAQLPPEQLASTRQLVYAQYREVYGVTVTCGCGRKGHVALFSRCFYCGVFFCPTCARKHFSVPEDYQRGE